MVKIVHDFDWSKAPEPWCSIGAEFREQCHKVVAAPTAPHELQRGRLARARQRLREHQAAASPQTRAPPARSDAAPLTEAEIRDAATEEIIRASRL